MTVLHFPEHPLGWHYESDGVIYVHIPKCASSAMKKAVEAENWTFGGTSPEFAVRGFAIIRNPLARFVSGLIEYYRSHSTTTLRDHEFEPWIKETLWRIERENTAPALDPHTQPQWQFLVPFSHIPIKLIPLFRLQDGVNEFFSSYGKKPPVIAVLNPTDPARLQFVRERLTAGLIATIFAYYHEDWVLYEDLIRNYGRI